MNSFFKILSSIIFTISSVGTISFAQQSNFDTFLSQLKIMGITVDSLLKQPAMSRYDMVYLLNLAECVDCFYPKTPIIEKYVQGFWSDFTNLPGKYFSDIPFWKASFDNKNYYYCVAYAGDQQYVNGFPQPTSPICGGKFCGYNTTTKAEFLQVVINIISKYIYRNYTADRKTIKAYIEKLNPDTYQYKNFNLKDRTIINSGANSCNQASCPLTSSDELKAYSKYCMFNLKACNFQPFGNIKEGYWPVSELNILYKQWIITLDEGLKTDIGKSVNGNEVLRILFRLKEVTKCSFDMDNDCDGLLNQNDNCPNTYNPKQTDSDKDGKGDVCDEDIDGDGITNPLGVADDEGNINIKKFFINPNLTGKKLFDGSNILPWDNCIFTKNPDQNWGKVIGDSCQRGEDLVGVRINSSRIEGAAPLKVNLSAFTYGNVKNIRRDLGNGIQKSDQTFETTFEKPWLYTISASAEWNNNTAIAKQTISVGENLDTYRWLQINASNLVGKTPLQTTFTISYTGQQDTFVRSFNNTKQTTTNKDLIVGKIFSTDWPTVVSVQSFANKVLVGATQMNIESWPKAKWTVLNTTNLRPKIWESSTFKTTIQGFTTADIENITRDMGEGQKIKNLLLQVPKIYQTAGIKIINQLITLKNWQTFNNIITITVLPREDISLSKRTFIQPTKLSLNKNQELQATNQLQNIPAQNILRIIHELGNGLGKVVYKDFFQNLTFSKRITASGILTPRTTFTLNSCQTLENQATVVVQWTNACLQALQLNNLDSYSCDEDGDGIPDICDDDIDGDGIKNELGMILFETPTCSYNENNLDQWIFNKHFQWSCSLDNCPFRSNANQSDLNINGKGDVCDADGINNINSWNNNTTTQDNDGRSENYLKSLSWDIVSKVCPANVSAFNCPGPNCPANSNAVCPGPNCPFSCPWPKCPGVAWVNCLQCPCQFAGYDGDLADGDQVRAWLRNIQGTINYAYSLPRPINQ